GAVGVLRPAHLLDEPTRYAGCHHAQPPAERDEVLCLRRHDRRRPTGDERQLEHLARRLRLLRRRSGPDHLPGGNGRVLLGLRPRRLAAHLSLRLLRPRREPGDARTLERDADRGDRSQNADHLLHGDGRLAAAAPALGRPLRRQRDAPPHHDSRHPRAPHVPGHALLPRPLVVYQHLGKWESHDFAEAARYLATKSWADGSRVAIMGTSYGGYSVVYSILSYPDVFAVGIANSPVTDWRLYDTIYTERYMGLLGDNTAGYDEGSAIKRADRLTGHLLLIHSMMDDNVHPQNTMQLLTALANA